MSSNRPAYNPYVGPRPYENNPLDIERFYGRTRETRDITALVSAQSTLLVYGKSGTGKSSLLNAAIIPALSPDEFYVQAPSARVQGVIGLDENVSDIPNIYIYNVLAGWANPGEAHETFARMRLADFLKTRKIPSVNDDGDRIIRVIIFDQFEELFTSYPKQWEKREDFFKQVREALDDPDLKPLRVVFVMREDYIAELDRFATILPDNLRTSFRLERLRRDQALLAINNPLEKTSRHFEPTAADELLNRLLEIRDADADVRPASDEFVEPVVLQVVCESMWGLLPDAVTVIGSDEVQRYAQVENSLQIFYEKCVNEAAAESGVELKAIRDWFGNKLITTGGTRGTVSEGHDSTEGLSNQAVYALARQHIIRGEERANARWYELAHDRFIEPIRRSNEAFLLEQERQQAEAERSRAKVAQDKYSAVAGASAFVAYSRQDQAFARRLFDGLSRYGVDTWVDWQNIQIGSDWMQELNAGIYQADNFIYIASPDAVRSEMVQRELSYALDAHKRVIPLIYHPGDVSGQLPPELRAIQVLSFRSDADFDATLVELLRVVDQEQGYVKEHTRLLLRAREWATRERDDSLLLRGTELNEAETWLAQSAAREPKPTDLQIQYILASRSDATRLRRRNQVILSVALVVALLLTGFSVIQAIFANTARGEAEQQATIAAVAQGEALILAATSERQAKEAQSLALAANVLQAVSEGQPDLALALAVAANRIPNPPIEARAALEAAVRESWIRSRFTAHQDRVGSVAYSPDGRFIASGSPGGTLILWDAATGQEIWSAPVAALSLAFSPDGTKIASVGNCARDQGAQGMRDFVKLTDVATGKPIPGREQDSITPITRLVGTTSLAFSPDGESVVYGCPDGRVHLWNVVLQEPTRPQTAHTGAVTSLSFSPDGQTFVSASQDRTLLLWDTAPVTVIRQYSDDTMQAVTSVAFSPDGQTFISGSVDGVVRLWDTETGAIMRSYDRRSVSASVQRVAVSPDGGRILAAYSDGLLILWDTTAGDNLRTLTGHNGPVLSVAFSPDGRTAVSGGEDNTVIVWDVADEVIQRYEGSTGIVNSIAFSPDGRLIASGSSDGIVNLWVAATADIFWTLAGHTTYVSSVAFSPDGRSVLSGGFDTNVLLWDTTTRDLIRRFSTALQVSDVAFSPSGDSILVAEDGGTSVLFDVATGAVLNTFGDLFPFAAHVVFSPDGRLVLSGDTSGQIILWDAKTGEEIRHFVRYPTAINSVTFSPDGRLALIGSADNTIILWDVESFEQVRRFEGLSDSVNSAAFSPDGQMIVSGSSDRLVTLWDVNSGEILRQYVGSRDAVNSVAFSPDGHTILSAADLSMIRWRVDYGPVDLLQWVPNNRYIPEFTCSQRQKYHVEPGCDSSGNFPTRTLFPTLTPNPTLDLTRTTATPTLTFTPLPTDTPSNTPRPTNPPLITIEPSLTITATALALNVTSTSTSTAAPLPAVVAVLASAGSAPESGFIAASFDQALIDLTGLDAGTLLRQPLLERALTDFAMSATITWGPGAPQDECGFVVRLSGRTGSFYFVSINRAGKLTFRKQINGNWSEPVFGNGSLTRVGRDETNRLLLVASGATFNVYMSGVYAAQFHDEDFPIGQVALAALNTAVSKGGSSCTFSDVWVWDFAFATPPPVAPPTLTPTITP